jgi:proline iminopeptidase
MYTNFSFNQSPPHEGYIPAKNAQLYYREIGHGLPIIILHGGPDFNHNYLLPDMDRLSTSFRLIYYDQRGRGKSESNVQPKDVSLESEIADIEILYKYFHLKTAAVLGHSWGGLLALEYALRYPQRLSHLILMNSAPVSHKDFIRFQQERRKKEASNLEKLKALSATTQYEMGDLETDAEYYRIHFQTTLRQPEHLEQVVNRLRVSFTAESVRKARVIENRLYDDTWVLSQYDLLPKLKRLNIPTLVIHGDYDFIPVVCAKHIARAIPGAQFILLKECGHFSYLECPEEVGRVIADFFDIRT